MEIKQEEYETIITRLHDLEQQVASIMKPDKKATLRNRVENPISGVRSDENKGIFYYSTLGDDTWLNFFNIAKCLVADLPKFTERRKSYFNYNDVWNYMENDRQARIKKVKEFTDEEFDLAVSMLGEMTAIYNRYYRELHKTVKVNFKDMEDGEFKEVEISGNESCDGKRR